jgi:nucleoside-diphosphate-sugar epimerase
MSRKILVTGASGFIGSHLIELLLEEKVPITSLRLFIFNNESLQNLPKLRFDIVRGDIRDKKAVAKAMNSVEVVYHLAARIDFDGKTYAEYEDVNVRGTQNFLEEARGKHLKKFVFFSSIGVFGMPAATGDILGWNETHKKSYTNFYGRSKWEGELRVMEEHKRCGLPYAIVRPASVYGPREKGPTLALYKAIKHHSFAMIGNGKNLMHYVYVKDLVRGARQAELSKKEAGDYILASAVPTSFRDVVQDVAWSIGASVPAWHIPTPLALAAAYGMQAVGAVTGIKPPLFPSRVRTMTTSYYYSIDKAKKELRYNPTTTFRQGANLTGAWYLKHHEL